jgi:hypothetical protein
MDAAATARLLAARLVALYLLSLVAVAGADLAWRDPGPVRLVGYATGFAFALMLGGIVSDASSAMAASVLRRRARLVAQLGLPLPGLVALVTALYAPALAGRAVAGLALLQTLVLLLCETLSLELMALWGALALAAIAGAGGGLPALVTLPGFLLCVCLFAALDHVAGRLAAWPGAQAPPLERVLAAALRASAVPVLLLAVALVLLPAPASHSLAERRGPEVEGEVQQAYRWLGVAALIGGGAMLLVMRWLRGDRGEEAATLVELPESHVLAEELIEPPGASDPRYAPARGRIIRAYLSFLRSAGEAGVRVERHLTPREIEARVRRPEAPLRSLTALFMDARYGPDEPAPDAVTRAEHAARDLCSELRLRPRARASG